MLPQSMAELYAKALDIRIVEIDEPWVERRHSIVIRSYDALQAASRRLVDHLRRSAA